MNKVLLFFSACACLSTVTVEARIRFEGYKVVRLFPTTHEQARLVKLLEAEGFHFWTGPAPANKSSDVMIPPHKQGDVLHALRNSGMEVTEFIQNIENLISKEEQLIQEFNSLTRSEFSFSQYHSLAEAHSFLDEIAANHSKIAKTVSIGKSFEGRDLKLLKISKSGETKPAIWFDSNIHAREWITSAVALYVVNELLTSEDPEVQSWTEDYDWYILPHHNPDGFEYSRTMNRMWRKTRSFTSSPLCRGVDPNRNFDFHWGDEGGSSTDPCSETYAGPHPFSETETKAASDFQTALGNRLNFVLSLHSYSQLMLIPFGVNVPFPQKDEYMRIGNLTVTAIAKKFGTQYTHGNIVDLLYIASGSSGDWAAGARNIPMTFTFELRDTGSSGFVLPASQILPSAQEFFDGLTVMMRELPAMIKKRPAAGKSTF